MQQPDGSLTIHAGRVLDGTGAAAATDVVVRIVGRSITSVGPAPSAGPPDERVLNFPNATLLPGLIDCHTHTNMPGDGRRGEDVHLGDDDAIRLLRSAHNVGRALDTGVTTVCDCGGWNQTTFRLKEGIQQGVVRGSRRFLRLAAR